MKRILFYVDPANDEYAPVVTWAADLVEAMTAESDDDPRRAGLLIAIVAPVECCCEIGVVMVGREDARTVEAGVRRISAVRLFPFVPIDIDDERFIAAAVEDLDGLVDAGAVEVERPGDDAGHSPFRVFANAEGALSAARSLGPWEGVVVLGSAAEASRDAVDRFGGDDRPPAIIRPLLEREVGELVEVMGRVGEREPEDVMLVRRVAATDAIRFAAMFDQLAIEPPDIPPRLPLSS